MQTRWRIELLGGLRAEDSDRTVTRFRSQKTGVLLAYLAYYLPRSHPREELIELLWPESEIDAGRHSLSQALSSLRNQLEPPSVPAGAVLAADRAAVGLNPEAVTTDVAEFDAALRAAAGARGALERAHALTQAVERYGGLLLAGSGGDWILRERQHLGERYFEALGQLIALQEEAGDLNRALETARRGVRADPLREEAHRELIRLLAAAGQPEAALRQYRELERLLRQELGETPEPGTRALVQGLANCPGRARVGTERPIVPPRTAIRLPSGTITFLLVTLEGAHGPREPTADTPPVPRGDPYALLRGLLGPHDGTEVPTVQGAFTAAFGRASDALACALAGQRALARHPGLSAGAPLARMALDTEEVRVLAGTYHGPVLHHAIQMLLAAHAGQILCSEETAALLRRHFPPDATLADLGLYRLHEKEAPERLFQVEYPEMPRQEFPAPQAAVGGSDSLPLQFTRFFGREAELARLTGLLHPDGTPLLLTLTGPGGSGKTRLALEAARRLREAWRGAIWYVPLADLTDGRRIAEAVRDAMRLGPGPRRWDGARGPVLVADRSAAEYALPPPPSRAPGAGALEQVVAALSCQPSLLLLDNFEHLVTDGLSLLETLRERVPTLACLVTSRQRLGLAGEREFLVPPLPIPIEGDDPLGLARCASVQLFVDRAQAVRPDFQVTRASAAALAALCRRLEGIPLALELAAARAQVLTPAQMLARLERRFDFLVSRQLRAAARHRTLRGAIDWSYQLLAPELRRFFAQLSVFRGGWTLEAATAVCEGAETLDHLQMLGECSLVLAEQIAHELRFRMLETLREYADEQLTPAERAAVEQRHAQYYLALAERAEPELAGPAQDAWLDHLDREHGNLQAALGWAVAQGETLVGLRLGGALHEFWEVRGYLGEGRQRLAALLALPGVETHVAARAKVLHGAGVLAGDQGDYPAARDLLEESLAISRALGDQLAIAASLHYLADVAYYQSDLKRARTLYQESLAIRRELGDPRGIARSLESLGNLVRRQDDLRTAEALYRESLGIRHKLGDRREIALAQFNLGNVALDRGNYSDARALHQESLTTLRELADRDGIADALANLGMVAYCEGSLGAAREFYEASVAIRRELGNRRCLAGNLNTLGDIVSRQGEHGAARALYEESLAIRRELGDRGGIAQSLQSWAGLACNEGRYDAARGLYVESLAIRSELGDRRGMIHCLEGLAQVAGMAGDAARAARIYGAADAWREAIGLVRPPVDRDEYDQRVAAVRARLGEDAFELARAEGQAMTPEQVIADASENARHD